MFKSSPLQISPLSKVSNVNFKVQVLPKELGGRGFQFFLVIAIATVTVQNV